MPRSTLIVRALEEFIKRRRNRKILEALNEVYLDVPDPSEEALGSGMRQKHRRLEEEEW